MPGADVAGVHTVVVEVFFAQEAVFVADKAVFFDRCRVEFELDFYVARDGGQR